jgi:hypothetical protein
VGAAGPCGPKRIGEQQALTATTDREMRRPPRPPDPHASRAKTLASNRPTLVMRMGPRRRCDPPLTFPAEPRRRKRLIQSARLGGAAAAVRYRPIEQVTAAGRALLADLMSVTSRR